MIEVLPMGEGAWRIALPAAHDPVATLDALRGLAGVTDVVVSDAHALVCFDPQRPPDGLAAALWSARRAPRSPVEHVIGVRYDGADLADVAARLGVDPELVIARHSGATYEVQRMGFLPGFAYLGPLAASLVLPRRAQPRARVPAGAVAIAGARTGVYPCASPGGWHLIGRTLDFKPFDAAEGARWCVGDRVRFEAR